MELLFKNARDVELIWKKEVKRTHDHCISFDLGSDWDFSNIESVFNIGERSEPEKFDYKKVKTTFGPPEAWVLWTHQSNLHNGPRLWQISGWCPDHPLLPMLEKEAHAQFYRDKNMWRNAARDRVLLNHFNNSGVT